MQKEHRTAGIAVAVGAAGACVLMALTGLFVVYTGAFNVAATEEHMALTRWAFDSTLHNAVERRATDIDGPAEFTPMMIAAGAGDYRAMCEHCHGGPGVDRAQWASGMRPQPPHLTEAAAEWEAHQVFWLIKHGIRMSGMPAFGPTHEDQALWNIAAMVRELPGMTAERYAALGDNHGSAETHNDSTH